MPGLYPNPGNNQLYITGAVGSNLQIWNTSGQLLASYLIETPKQSLAVNQLPAGLYLLQFEREGQHYWTRWMKL